MPLISACELPGAVCVYAPPKAKQAVLARSSVVRVAKDVAPGGALSVSQSAKSRGSRVASTFKAAFVTTISAAEDVRDAVRLRQSLEAVGSLLETVAIVHGAWQGAEASNATFAQDLRAAGWRIILDVTDLDLRSLFTPIVSPTAIVRNGRLMNATGLHWPRRGTTWQLEGKHWRQKVRPGYVNLKLDGGRSALKLCAWNLTRYDMVLVADAAVNVLERPEEWLSRHAPHRYFAAEVMDIGDSRAPTEAGGMGLRTELMFLRPNRLIGRLLADMAQTASFVPRTNTIADVLETAMPLHVPMPPMLRHRLRSANRSDGMAGADAASRVDGWDIHNASVSPQELPSHAVQAPQPAAVAWGRGSAFPISASASGRGAPALARFGLITVVCHRVDFYGSDPNAHYERAVSMKQSLKNLGSNIQTTAIVSGVPPRGLSRLRQAGWGLIDVTRLPLERLFRPILQLRAGYHAPRGDPAKAIQPRRDGGCTALKLLAWNMTQYTHILLVDADTCFQQCPLRWLEAHSRLGSYFVARAENEHVRGYSGINSHMVLLQPDAQLFAILTDHASTASYIPHSERADCRAHGGMAVPLPWDAVSHCPSCRHPGFL